MRVATNPRDGIPLFAARLRRREPATIVAFGTSLTSYGRYWEGLEGRLRAAASGAPVAVFNGGLRGFVTATAAFRVADKVLIHRPDLVLFEFAHNDASSDSLGDLAPALYGMIAQIRAVRPTCEFAFVYFAPRGLAVDGPTLAMQAYERIADELGVPSIDMATFCERLVADGMASWDGPLATALTRDAVHHSDRAAELLAPGFADALVELLEHSPASAAPPAPVPMTKFAHAYRIPITTVLARGSWAVGEPPNHHERGADAYDSVVAVAGDVGAAFRVELDCAYLAVWAIGSGSIIAEVNGSRVELPLAYGANWVPYPVIGWREPGHFIVDVTVKNLHVILGDLLVGGAAARLPGGPAAVDR